MCTRQCTFANHTLTVQGQLLLVLCWKKKQARNTQLLGISLLLDISAGRMWVSNLGDSRVLLVHKNFSVTMLTVDQDADNKNELRRIKNEGGTVGVQ